MSGGAGGNEHGLLTLSVSPSCSRALLFPPSAAIRALMKFDVSVAKQCDRSSLRVLGSVGEPINPEAWRWYFDVAGDSKVPICDTYWQTETGGHILTPLPGCTPLKPGSATLPFFGILPLVLHPESGAVQEGPNVSGVLAIKQSWPGVARTIYGDHQRYLSTYMKCYKGQWTPARWRGRRERVRRADQHALSAPSVLSHHSFLFLLCPSL